MTLIIIYWRWARIRTGSEWIRTEGNFGRIRTRSDCNLFNWRSRTGGLDRTEKICCFDVIILTTSKILVVMWFYRFIKW